MDRFIRVRYCLHCEYASPTNTKRTKGLCLKAGYAFQIKLLYGEPIPDECPLEIAPEFEYYEDSSIKSIKLGVKKFST